MLLFTSLLDRRLPYRLLLICTLAGSLLVGPMAHAADAARGAVVARVRCMPCHFLNRTEKRIGPGLLGVYGRAPSITGVPFSRWDAPALDAWLANPRRIKINTTMFLPPLQQRDRADVIAWLREKDAGSAAIKTNSRKAARSAKKNQTGKL